MAMDKIYIYDGSFEGLLTAIHEAYYRREQPMEILCDGDLQQWIFAEFLHVKTDEMKADKVYRSIREKISVIALQNIYRVFLSESEGAGTMIYNYLKLGWRVGPKITSFLADDNVLKVHSISKKVEGEYHRFLGFVRFKKLISGIYYASIEPDNNIVGLLAPHFADRLANQNWTIHDVKRKIAAIFNGQQWVVTDFDFINESPTFVDEDRSQDLWKAYFTNIAIKTKLNPKLQRQHLPARYWKHLTEKQL